MLIYTIYVSFKVNSTFKKYESVHAANGKTAAEIARDILDQAGLSNVQIHATHGRLTDHFNPRDNSVYLSQAVMHSRSVAAIGVAAHEAGHAIQYNEDYFPMKARQMLFPLARIGSSYAILILIVSVILEAALILDTTLTTYVIWACLAFFAFSTLFSFITLPVEFNASSRAKRILVESGNLTREEVADAGKVLNAAAKTYVASFAFSLLQLIRLIAIFGRRR
jgi:hypothetical protein